MDNEKLLYKRITMLLHNNYIIILVYKNYVYNFQLQ